MSQLNYVDIIIFFILLLDFFSGIRIGAIVFLSDIVSFIAAWFVAKALFSNFSAFLIERSNLMQWITKTITPVMKIPESLSNLQASLQNIQDAVNNMGVPDFIKDFIIKDFGVTSQTVSQFITDKVSTWIVNGIAFIIIFFIVLILVRIIGFIIKKILRFNPFLKWVDVLFGGILKIAVSIIIIFIVLEIIMSVFGFLNVQNSNIIYHIKYSWFYSNMSKVFPSIKDFIVRTLSQFK
jgi:uncharacterized membrane protein required for colicin V production